MADNRNGSTTSHLPDVDQWAVAWTKARAEKRLVEYLHELRVASFLPLVRRRRVYGKRVRESKVPLFPGYVFFDAGGIERQRVFESRKVANVIYTDDQERLKSELASLAIAIEQQPILHPVPFDTAGRSVRVSAGTFKGMIGELVRRQNQSVLVIKITLLGRAVEMQIDEAFLEPN